jgi:hypothetical protein
LTGVKSARAVGEEWDQEVRLMKTLIAAVACALALPVLADAGLPECRKDPQARGLAQRVENIREQMERAELSTDRAEQRRLLELHAKTMHEGMRELRRRHASPGCREEMMHAMMEQMMRHQLALQDTP